MRFDFEAAVREYGSVEQRESGSARRTTDITFHFATPNAPRTKQVEITIIIMNSAVRGKSSRLRLICYLYIIFIHPQPTRFTFNVRPTA